MLMDKYKNNGASSDVLPVYLGDDVTDEDGFRAIQQFGRGITIHIGNDIYSTVADYFLRSPEETIEFLQTLLECSLRGFIPDKPVCSSNWQ